MWLTNRDAITGLETTEMPYRAITSTFNAVSGGGEVIFDEPYYVKNQTIFFTVSKLTSKSLVSIEACGMVTEGEEVYERDGKAITNIKRSGVRHYIPSNRDSNGKPVIELSKEKMLTKNAKLALKYDTFYSMSRRNNKRKKM